MAAPIAPSASTLATEQNRIRFETELEFVQCLANPFYLQSLAQKGLFEDEAFRNYLVYLRYWKEPRFARFIQYPQALHHLDLLTHVGGGIAGKGTEGKVGENKFMKALREDQNVALELAGRQLAHWAGWREEGKVGEKKGEGGGEMMEVES